MGELSSARILPIPVYIDLFPHLTAGLVSLVAGKGGSDLYWDKTRLEIYKMRGHAPSCRV